VGSRRGAVGPGERGNEPGAPTPGEATPVEARPGEARPGEAAPDDGSAERADQEALARAVCLRLLTGAPRTRAQLARSLARRNVSEDIVERVLARFADVGLIDDAAFAAAWVEARHAGRGMGRKGLAHELRTRGVDDELVEEAVGELDPVRERATARTLVDKKLRGMHGVEPRTKARRLAGMLARRGYSGGLALSVIREALEDEGSDTEGLDEVAFDD
jgi:regulatory protein